MNREHENQKDLIQRRRKQKRKRRITVFKYFIKSHKNHKNLERDRTEGNHSGPNYFFC